MSSSSSSVVPLISSWTSKPIPNFTLSASGLLALADLQTIANRTALTGGSSWLDALVLAPGLHYQQAADTVQQMDTNGNGGQQQPLYAVERSNYGGGGGGGDRGRSGGGGAAPPENRDSTYSGRTVYRTSNSQDMDDKRSTTSMSEGGSGEGNANDARHCIQNVALRNYLERLRRTGAWTTAEQQGTTTNGDNGGDDGNNTLTLDVSRDDGEDALIRRLRGLLMQKRKKKRRLLDGKDLADLDLDWISQILYLASPLLTITAIILMILLADWWGLSFVFSLMISRILNIITIKRRTRLPSVVKKSPVKRSPPTHSSSDPLPMAKSPMQPAAAPLKGDDGLHLLEHRLTEYVVDLGHGHTINLRGLASDLQALTTQAWMSSKDHLDGYLEAAAKLIVYLSAAFSGNVSQAGGLVLMSLLLLSAGLLGLSNGHVTSFRMHGRIAREQRRAPPRKAGV